MTYFRSVRRSEVKISCDRWNGLISAGKDPFYKFSVAEYDRQLREDLIGMFGEFDPKDDSYYFDAHFGLKLYIYTKSLGMTESDAANDEYWMYIQTKVIPDLVYKRWLKEDGKVNDDRFWKKTSRIYLKVIWWYIDLIWAGSAESTEAYFAKLDISQITDRSGHDGTRRDVYRALLHMYSKVPEKQRGKKLISKVLMLNSTYCSVIEPELMNISLDEYARKIYREVGIDV